MEKKQTSYMMLSLLLIWGVVLRIYGLWKNYSFWSDENHVAVFVRAILQKGKPVLDNGYTTGVYQFLYYYTGAFFSKLFGLSEFSLRLPSVLVGGLTIIMVYVLAQELFNKRIAILSAFFTTFLRIEVLWSRQARPYQFLQLFFAAGMYFIYKYTSKKKKADLILFLLMSSLAVFFHKLGIVIVFNGLIFLFLTAYQDVKKWIKYLFPILLILVFFSRSLLIKKIQTIEFFKLNFFYYRIFLQHNYLFLILFSLLGFTYLISLEKVNKIKLVVIPIITQAFIVSIFTYQSFVRYFYIIFPFIILLSSVGIYGISKKIIEGFNRKKLLDLSLMSTVLLTVILFNSKFVFAPQEIYSLNADMQEIPEVDWKKTYRFVENKLEQNPEAVVVTNWNDLPIWYLGEGSLDYLVRNKDKDTDPVSSAVYINSLRKFQGLVENKDKGIIVIDSWDDQIPEGIKDYLKNNLNKEFEVKQLFPGQPRDWPVYVYSWGM